MTSTDRVADVVVAVRTHVDVTRRVLFPMVRRVGDDDGDRLADAAEAQERTLLRLVGEVDESNDPRRTLQDIGVAMHEHTAIGDEILELLRAELDPIERSSLADGLAAARATSTVSRLFRSASRAPAPVPPALPQRHDDDLPVVEGSSSSIDPSEGRCTTRRCAPRSATKRLTSRPSRPPSSAEQDHARHPRPHRDKPGALRSMLVGVDGSPAAGAALEWAGRLAGRLGAEIVVANVFEPDQAEVSPDDYEKLIADAERRLAEEWAAPLQGMRRPTSLPPAHRHP